MTSSNTNYCVNLYLGVFSTLSFHLKICPSIAYKWCSYLQIMSICPTLKGANLRKLYRLAIHGRITYR